METTKPAIGSKWVIPRYIATDGTPQPSVEIEVVAHGTTFRGGKDCAWARCTDGKFIEVTFASLEQLGKSRRSKKT